MNRFERQMAMLEELGMTRGVGGMSTYNPNGQRRVQQQTQRREATRAKLPDGILERAAQVQIGGARQPDTGGGGVLGKVLNNPIGRGVTGALDAVDVFRRAGVLAFEEGAEMLGGGVLKDGLDSERGILDRLGDSSYGFGGVTKDTGNKWLDRGIGFVGDVALDPLTYLTFGTGKLAGITGRNAAAARILDKGGDAASARKIARLGPMGANAAERELIFGAGKQGQTGMRFMGKRIAGTGKGSEVLGRGLAETRAKIGDIPLIDKAKGLRRERGLEDVLQQLAAGKGDTVGNLAQLAGQAAAKGDSGMFAARFENQSDLAVNMLTKSDDDAVSTFHAIDQGLELTPDQARFQQIFAEVGQGARAKGVDFDMRANYVPHTWTDKARDALKKNEALSSALGQDLTKKRGSTLARQIEPGETFTLPTGEKIMFEADTASGAVSAQQINDKLSGPLGVAKVIEDDITKVLAPYIQGMAGQVGAVSRVKRVGALAGVDEDAATKMVRDLPLEKRLGDVIRSGNKRQLNKAVTADRNMRGDLTRTAERTRRKTIDELEVLVKQGDRAARKELAEAQRAEKILRDIAKQSKTNTKASAKNIEELTAELAEIEASGAASSAARAAETEALTASRDALRAQKKRGVKDANTELGRLADEEAEALTALDARRGEIMADRSAAEKARTAEMDMLDHARQAQSRRMLDAKGRQGQAQADVREAKAAIARLRRLQTSPNKATTEAYKRIDDELNRALESVGKYEGSEMTADLLAQYGKGVAELSDGKALQDGLRFMQKEWNSGELPKVVKMQLHDAYERLGADLVGEGAPIIRKDLARQLKNFDVAIDDSQFVKVMNHYTRFFKTYATARVGFHVRNGMGAMFMNAADGVSVKHMGQGAKMWEAIVKNPKTWMDNLPQGVSREQAEDALRAVYASGGGGGSFGSAEVRLGESVLTNNKLTRASQRLGSRVEGVARMGMALDTMMTGGTFEEAAARITRVQFDYSSTSKLDDKLKQGIPFFTFMSRNLPLQVTQMMMKPKLYQHYNAIRRNMGEDYEGDFAPLNWQERGAFKFGTGEDGSLGEDLYVQPDFAHLPMESDLEKFTSRPAGLLESLNPILRVPAELQAGKRFFGDRDFFEGGVAEADGGLEALRLLGPLGITMEAGDGSTVVDEKLAYAIRSLIPTLGTAGRLFGKGDYVGDKRLQSVLQELGIPIKQLTPGQVEREKNRRTREAESTDTGAAARQRALENFGR